MRPRTWIAVIVFAALTLAFGSAWDAGLFAPRPPPLVDTPAAVEAGRAVFLYRCVSCHRDVPLAKRVAGWSKERAYETIGRLPAVPRGNMPAFPGTEEERRALAVFLAAMGSGKARQPGY